MHENWYDKTTFIELIKERAARRNLKDLTIGPVLSVTNQEIQSHISNLLQLEKAEVLFGGNTLKEHSIPSCYGSFEPTAVFVPIESMLKDEESFKLVTKEIFGPFQIITKFSDDELPKAQK